MARFLNGNLILGQSTETMTGNKTLVLTDAQQQFLNPDGEDRVVQLPSQATSVGLSYSIFHIGSANTITVQNGSGTTIKVLNAGESGNFAGNGTVQVSAGGVGATGAAGAQGEKGDTGGVGGTGAQGEQGATGGVGGTGAQGEQGIQGATGGVGGTGAQGEQGIQGATGGVGGTGAAGAKGDTGDRGEGFNIDRHEAIFDEADVTDIVTNSSATPTNVYVVTIFTDSRSNKNLPAGIAGDKSKHVVMFDGTDWYDWGLFIGDTGGTGAQGDQGTQGTAGNDFNVDRHETSFVEADVTDIEANSGATATDIYSTTILVDDRTNKNLPAGIAGDMSRHIVAYNGTDWFDWGIFIGNTGAAGAVGGTGAQGEQGATGGVGGTGAQGDQGIQGATGGVGGTGTQGETGAAGADGTDGTITDKAGTQSITADSNSISVVFTSSFANTNYSIGCQLRNSTDSTPSIYPTIITAKTAAGFTVKLTGNTDSANYYLDWICSVYNNS